MANWFQPKHVAFIFLDINVMLIDGKIAFVCNNKKGTNRLK
jgi:hypothetical protein